MQTIMTIGLDIAKSVFQVHGVDAAGEVVIRRQLKRRSVLAFFQKLSPCLVGIEACASSHYWSRELQALGHTVRLMPPIGVFSILLSFRSAWNTGVSKMPRRIHRPTPTRMIDSAKGMRQPQMAN